MRVVYDQSVDAAYIHLLPTEEPGEVVATSNAYYAQPLRDKTVGQIWFDHDEHGHLIGIEILVASMVLPTAVLEAAEQLSRNDPEWFRS